MAKRRTARLVFDIESAADGELIAKIRYPGKKLSSTEAIQRYRSELIEQNGKDFIPYTFQLPVSLVVATVADDYSLIDLVALDEELSRPHEIVRLFWEGWRKNGQPQLVSFNGRGFDMPLLEVCAFRYGLGIPEWIAENGRSFEQPRNRFNSSAHLDLHEFLTNNGASRFVGGLSLAANLIGKPGKLDVAGHMVQDLWDGVEHVKFMTIVEVMCSTRTLFICAAVCCGAISLADEQSLIEAAHIWIQSKAAGSPGLARYLEAWGDWQSPWG